jgi:2-oxoglutarate ferredoxin oxidoreductase subunit alpha
VIAARSPRDCFDAAFEASKLALKYMTPVVLLTDGYLANGAEAWRVPTESELPEIKVNLRTKTEDFLPYERDPKTLARPWAIPGTPGLEHRVGGLEKEDRTGAVSNNAENHEKMCKLRAEKIERMAQDFAPITVEGDPHADLLVLGWGSTYGVVTQTVRRLNKEGVKVACANLRYLNPFPKDLGPLLKKYKKVLVPELNLGQLWYRIRAEYLIDTERMNKVQGQPLRSIEIEKRIKGILAEMKK